jgi:heme exporter protein B
VNFSEVKYLFLKEFQLELRKKAGINSILLFAVATTFISYLALDNIEHAPTWNALFWIIILFAFINAANNTFRNDTENTQGYLNQLAHPNSILAAKTLYNAFLMTITGLVNYFCYSLFIGNLIENQWLFLLLIIIAALGFAAVLSLTNAISSKASFNNTLMPILSLPVLIPFFIILVAQTNHLIGNKEYQDFSYTQGRELMETEIICKKLSGNHNLPWKAIEQNFTATDYKNQNVEVIYFGYAYFKFNEPLILKGKMMNGKFYASQIWNKATVSSSSNIKYYGALALLTAIVLVVGQFLFPKIAKF